MQIAGAELAKAASETGGSLFEGLGKFVESCKKAQELSDTRWSKAHQGEYWARAEKNLSILQKMVEDIESACQVPHRVDEVRAKQDFLRRSLRKNLVPLAKFLKILEARVSSPDAPPEGYVREVVKWSSQQLRFLTKTHSCSDHFQSESPIDFAWTLLDGAEWNVAQAGVTQGSREFREELTSCQFPKENEYN